MVAAVRTSAARKQDPSMDPGGFEAETTGLPWLVRGSSRKRPLSAPSVTSGVIYIYRYTLLVSSTNAMGGGMPTMVGKHVS